MANPKTATNPKGGGRTPGPRPDLQIYPGILREKRLGFVRMRAQAKFRRETWDLTWDEFLIMWEGKWHLRGRDNLSLCMTRIDWEGVWNKENVVLITRTEHVRKQAKLRTKK